MVPAATAERGVCAAEHVGLLRADIAMRRRGRIVPRRAAETAPRGAAFEIGHRCRRWPCPGLFDLAHSTRRLDISF
jgi:hypothetical protein